MADISEDLLEICKMKTTKKGTIIALKRLCDYTIKSFLSIQESNISSNKSNEYEIEAITCNKQFVVSPEKTETFKKITPNKETRRENKKTTEKVKKLIK